MYFRQHGDCYGVGSYRHVPLMVEPRDLGNTAKLPFMPEHFEAGWESATELMPALKKTEIVTKFNGMFAFTIDGYPVMGELMPARGEGVTAPVRRPQAGTASGSPAMPCRPP